MRKYSDLTQHQKDKATDKALEILIELLVKEGFDYQFYSLISQKCFLDSFKLTNKKEQISMLLNSDEIAEELYNSAEMLAEYALYPSNEECVIEGIY